MDVIFDPENERGCTVVVPDYQLSLAIGKRGQNARLAAKLTGFKIDIKSETEASDIMDANPDDVAAAETAPQAATEDAPVSDDVADDVAAEPSAATDVEPEATDSEATEPEAVTDSEAAASDEAASDAE